MVILFILVNVKSQPKPQILYGTERYRRENGITFIHRLCDVFGRKVPNFTPNMSSLTALLGKLKT